MSPKHSLRPASPSEISGGDIDDFFGFQNQAQSYADLNRLMQLVDDSRVGQFCSSCYIFFLFYSGSLHNDKLDTCSCNWCDRGVKCRVACFSRRASHDYCWVLYLHHWEYQ